MIESQIKYIISQADIDKLKPNFRRNTVFVYQEENEMIMDYSIIQNLKLNSKIDVIISSQFEENSFDEWLSNREKPYYVIYKYMAKHFQSDVNIYDTPFDIDFKTHLKKKPEKKSFPKVKGVPTKTEQYEKKYISIEDGRPVTVYENKISEINFQLMYTGLGFIYKKIAMLSWVKSDGSIDTNPEVSKDLGETFDSVLDSGKIIKEGVDRRRSIYDELQLPALGILKQAMPTLSDLEIMMLGRSFMSFYDDEFNGFIYESRTILTPNHPDFGMKSVASAIKNDSEPNHAWLDTTVNLGFGPINGRQFFIGQLSI